MPPLPKKPKKTSLAEKLRGKIKPITWTLRPEVLLCPNVPKPMHGVAPRVILGQTWWDQTRDQAYRSTAFHCIACGVYKGDALFRKWMEGHELYDIDYLLGRMTYLEAIPLCHACHNFIHDGRLQALLDKGEIHQAKYVQIIQHGNRVLRMAGLRKPEPYAGPCADWADWRLVLEGKEYPPKFPSFEAWRQAFGV